MPVVMSFYPYSEKENIYKKTIYTDQTISPAGHVVDSKFGVAASYEKTRDTCRVHYFRYEPSQGILPEDSDTEILEPGEISFLDDFVFYPHNLTEGILGSLAIYHEFDV